MNPSFFLQGLIIGLSIAAPVGPIGVLCIRRTLTAGPIAGLVSGLGAATADAMYGCIAGFGLTVVANLLVSQQSWLQAIGGIFLCYLGIKTFLSKPATESASARGSSLINAYLSTLFLTLTNPLTILSFAAIFAGLGLVSTNRSGLAAGILVLGVFLGSALWWVFLSCIVGTLRMQFNSSRLQWVNRISGAIITIFGLSALLGLLLPIGARYDTIIMLCVSLQSP